MNIAFRLSLVALAACVVFLAFRYNRDVNWPHLEATNAAPNITITSNTITHKITAPPRRIADAAYEMLHDGGASNVVIEFDFEEAHHGWFDKGVKQ